MQMNRAEFFDRCRHWAQLNRREKAMKAWLIGIEARPILREHICRELDMEEDTVEGLLADGIMDVPFDKLAILYDAPDSKPYAWVNGVPIW